eukprot:TRINITY_DN3835_c0_g1_i1.p1 TRINITY_DN3835_c0_g1~~TRINITY_DN3835_c0_g1_i1.p1  ORF type:complete len:701 (+),score=344.80 TRINITY_DN3835_c0_g1_i1:266-2368(+)
MIGVGDAQGEVLEMWEEPDVLRCRLYAWGAGAEDKPTVMDYACPLLHMLPVLRRRFASQLAPPGHGVNRWLLNTSTDDDDDAQNADDAFATSRRSGSKSPRLGDMSERPGDASSTSSSSPSFLHTLRATSRRKPLLLPEVTLRLVESGANGRSFWLSTARSLRDQGCTPANSARSILEVHRVRTELLRMPKQIDAHRILLRGPLTVQAFGRNDEPLGKKRSYWCTLIDHFLFLHKKAEKTADAVVLLEYHTVHLVDTRKGRVVSVRAPPTDATTAASGSGSSDVCIELRRQNLLYSPSYTLSYRLECPNGIEKRRWYELIGQHCMPGETRVFGVSLDELAAREQDAVPRVVRACAAYLRDGARLNTIGLFRKAGQRAVVEFARDLFDAGGRVDLDAVPRIDEVTAAALLKLFFADLPEPLVPFRFYDALIATGGDSDRVVALATGELPTGNLELLFFLATLLAQVCTRSARNKMTPHALGIIFGPTLMRQRHGELSDERLVADTVACSAICEVFIRRAAALEPSADRRTVHASSIAEVRVDWAVSRDSSAAQSTASSDALDLATSASSAAMSSPASPSAAVAPSHSATPFSGPLPATAMSTARPVYKGVMPLAKAKAMTMHASSSAPSQPENPYQLIPNVQNFGAATPPAVQYGTLPKNRDASQTDAAFAYTLIPNAEALAAANGSDLSLDFSDLDNVKF